MTNPLEDNAFIRPEEKQSYQSVSLNNFSVITSIEKFNSLTFWNKLTYLKESVNIPLLQEIRDKTESKQFKTLSVFRLYQLDS